MKRIQKQATHAKREEQETPAPEPASSETGEALKAELDDVLDEIDSVLEENAEEFVRGFIQKGGQ